MPILFSEGVVKGRIDLPTFVAITATNAAKLFGLHPRKGTIAVGSDADIAIWDPAKRVTITQSLVQDANDHTPYEGLRGDRLAGDHAGARRAGGGGRQGGRRPRAWPVPAAGPYDLIKPRGVFPGPFNPVDGVAV